MHKTATLKKTKIGFQDQLSLNAGQTYGRMLQGEHSAIRMTFIKLQFVIKTFVLSIFEWPLMTGFTVLSLLKYIWYFIPLPLMYIQHLLCHNRVDS